MASLLNPSKVKEKIMSILHKLFQEIDEKGTFSNSFYEARITLIPNPYEDITRKVQINNPHEYGHTFIYNYR